MLKHKLFTFIIEVDIHLRLFLRKEIDKHYMYMDIRLKDLCQLRGITQKELAVKLNVTEMTLSRASKGNTSMQLLERIAETLNVEVWELFTEVRDKRDFIAMVKDGKNYYNASSMAELEKIVLEIKEKREKA